MTGAEYQLFACTHDGRSERAYDATDPGDWVRMKSSEKVAADWLAAVPDVDVRSVTLFGRPKRSDEEVAALIDRFPNLEELRLAQAKGLTDRTCELVANGLPKLSALWIFMSSVGDEGALRLTDLPALEHLAITNARLTDVGVEALGRVRNLKTLRIDGNFRITGDGLAGFKDHPALAEIWLGGARITDDAVSYLSGCTSLEKTLLTSTAVTADCVRLLPQNPMAIVDLPRGLDPAEVDAVRRDCPNLIIDGYRSVDMSDLPALADTPAVPAALGRNGLTLAVFSAPWCAPCVDLKKEISLVRANLREQYRYVEIDIEDDPDAAAQMHIRTLPSTVVLVDGREAVRFHGAAPERVITELLERFATY